VSSGCMSRLATRIMKRGPPNISPSFMSWSRSTWQTSWHKKHSMHLRNSWTRSTSSWAMRQVPSASLGRGLNGGVLFFARLVPRHVRHQIFDERERVQRLQGDWLILRHGVHARHAHEARLAVDLRGAGAALARLAVPAARQVRRLRRLDLVDGVEHDHALADL